MPKWAGKWKGGRWYPDELGRPVFFIERRGKSRRVPGVHDETTAEGMLGLFLDNPTFFDPKRGAPAVQPVYITAARIRAYLASIKATVIDHRAARDSYLRAWSEHDFDLRTVDRERLRAALAACGGQRGRTEALNAFGRWLVREGELDAWRALVAETPPKPTRAVREAYTLEQLRETWGRLVDQPVRDVFYLRAATGMHHTEIEQLHEARDYTGPLPDKGTGVRTLPAGHAIAGVLQVMHKSRRRHRQSVDAAGLAAATRLRAYVPGRSVMWEALDPLVPSNLRHTFATLAGECGELVEYTAGGVDRGRVAQAMGHRAGSTMLPDRYERIQVPPMLRLPLGF